MTYLIELIEIDKDGNTTDTTIYPEIGFSVVEKLNEELDIGSMELKFLNKSTPYGMFDTIRISIGGSLVYSMRIGGDSVSLASKKPLLYNHSLSLVEHTKILERVIISGKTFTQPTDGSTQLTLFDVIDTLRLVYPLETTGKIATTRLFTIPFTLETYLKTIISPEFTFKDITLREGINQVLDYVDGIARLNEDSELEVQFFNELVNLIDDETGNYNKITQQDIDFYATDMTVSALNMVNDNDESEIIEIYPAKGAFISARSDQFVFDFTKSYIPTQKPIYKVNKVVSRIGCEFTCRIVEEFSVEEYNILVDLDGAGYVNATACQNIPLFGYDNTNGNARVLEYDKYKLLDVHDTDFDEPNKYYQSNTIYYNYGERNITQSGTEGLWDTKANITTALRNAAYQWLLDNNAIADDLAGTPISSLPIINVDVIVSVGLENDYIYQVHYTPIPKSTRFNIDRQDLTDVYKKSSLMANQQSRIVNTSNFLNNISGKINKIGNSELYLSNRTSKLDNIYNVGDYTEEKYILTNKEVIFFNDFFDCKYELSRNWNKLSQFIGVNSEVRQWEIGEKGRTLERDLLYKEYIEIDVVESGSGSNTSELLNIQGVSTYLNTFDPTATTLIDPISCGMINNPDVTLQNLISISSNGGGNNLLFRFNFNHNRDAGSYVNDRIGQRTIQYNPYADSDGKIDDFYLYLFDKMVDPATEADYLINADLYPQTETASGDTLLISGNTPFRVYKDNREIMSMMYQLQHISLDINNVIIGRALSNKNALINENKPSSIKLYVYDTKTFGKNDNLKVISDGLEYVPTLVIDYTNNRITVVQANLDATASAWCLTDENDNILIAVNQNGTLLDTITFDFLNKRSKINYNY